MGTFVIIKLLFVLCKIYVMEKYRIPIEWLCIINTHITMFCPILQRRKIVRCLGSQP